MIRQTLLKGFLWNQKLQKLVEDLPQGTFFGGKSQKGRGGDLPIASPCDELVLSTINYSSQQDVEEARNASQFAAKKLLSAVTRSTLLAEIGDIVKNERMRLAQLEALCTGMTIRDAMTSVSRAAEMFAVFAEAASTALNLLPSEAKTEVVDIIVPCWFHFEEAMAKIVPAVASGHGVIWHVSPNAPLSSLYFAKILQRISTVQPTPICIVQGGNNTDPSINKPKNLSSIVIGDGCSPAQAAATALTCFANSGQSLSPTRRLYIREADVMPFYENLVKIVEELKLGHCLDPRTDVGPLRSLTGLEKVLDSVKSATQRNGEKTVVAGGFRAQFPAGYFLTPTVLNISDFNDPILTDCDVLGPIVCVVGYTMELDRIVADEIGRGCPFSMVSNNARTTLDRARALGKKNLLHVNKPVMIGPYFPSVSAWKAAQ